MNLILAIVLIIVALGGGFMWGYARGSLWAIDHCFASVCVTLLKKGFEKKIVNNYGNEVKSNLFSDEVKKTVQQLRKQRSEKSVN